ncbi:MAG: DUF933 domain-containing protein [Fimbriimonadaceae bacterium]
MNVAIIGYSSSGKSTLYRAAGGGSGDLTAVPVPDPRFDRIVAQVQPKKITPATVLLQDGLDPIKGDSSKMFSQRFLDQARKCQVLLHVVRSFESPIAPFHAEIDPARDVQAVDVELVLTDLQIVENRLERLTKSAASKNPGSPEYAELKFFEQLVGPLGEGTPIRNLEMNETEQAALKNYQFLSAKPLVVAFNVSEEEAGSPSPKIARLIEELGKQGVAAFAVSAQLEEELAQLSPEEQPAFLADLGIEQPASAKLIQAVYEALGLITFYTAGENETRAWPLRRGSSALKAAGTIHNDIAKGFIRAEVVSYEDYDEAGSLDTAYSAGKMRLEGKEYVVQEGDLLHIRNKS